MAGADFVCVNEDCLTSGSLDPAWQDIQTASISDSGSFHSHCPECATVLWYNVVGSSVTQQE